MLLLSYISIKLLSFKCPAKLIASWLIPSIKQPSPQKTYTFGALDNFFSFESFLSAMAIPTAFEIPCPRGPVVISIPASGSYSGCPAVI